LGNRNCNIIERLQIEGFLNRTGVILAHLLPVSGYRLPVSGIRNPVSGIQDPAAFLNNQSLIMNIVLIGSGNVAWNLGKLLKQKGHNFAQVLSTNATTASELAYELDTESSNYWTMLNRLADLYIVAVPDNALPEVCGRLRLGSRLVVHTSGAVPMHILKECSENYGLLYPLQSLKRGVATLPEIPLLVDGSSETVKVTLQQLAQQLSPRVALTTDEQRLKMHVAAVLVNNFTNHLYVLAQQWCQKNGLDFTQLHPLITETAQKLTGANAAALQTGPAVRNDTDTIARHKALLKDEPQLLKVYEVMTESIMAGGGN
jgi:predicted short-subunit dehydrogenase-like oxidoreductase (DUF2520 family)